MDFSNMSVEEAQRELSRQRRTERVRNWGMIAAVMAVALVGSSVLVGAAGVSAALYLPVLALAAVVCYGMFGVTGRV